MYQGPHTKAHLMSSVYFELCLSGALQILDLIDFAPYSVHIHDQSGAVVVTEAHGKPVDAVQREGSNRGRASCL